MEGDSISHECVIVKAFLSIELQGKTTGLSDEPVG